jgi:hypothetical protein
MVGSLLICIYQRTSRIRPLQFFYICAQQGGCQGSPVAAGGAVVADTAVASGMIMPEKQLIPGPAFGEKLKEIEPNGFKKNALWRIRYHLYAHRGRFGRFR